MTSELRPSESISEFVSGGPKNNAYRGLTADGREKNVCKVRVITLNYNAFEMLNFDIIRYMILGGNKCNEPTALNLRQGNKIERKKAVCANVPNVTEAEDK